MSSIALVKRNLKLFLRDRATVFFSFLSTIILVSLYFLFIARSYTLGMDNPEMGGIALKLTEQSKNFLVYLQMMAGVLVLNSMSLATGVFGTIAKDFEEKRIDGFMLTPISTIKMITSYFLTGVLTSFVLNVFTWTLSTVIIGAVTGYWINFGIFFAVILVLFVASLISSGIMLLITSLVKSSAAIGVVGGVSGTFFGFLCGIYMPYSGLGEGTKMIGSFLPFTHLTIWLKQVVLNDAFAQLEITGEMKTVLNGDFFSAENIGFAGISAPMWALIIGCVGFGILCLMLSCFVLNKRIKKQ